MQLTRYTDYALRVLIYLAHKEELATINEISVAYKVSENHLMKIVHGLAKLGYINTLRGKGGGMKLARPADKINLGEVVRNTEETLHVVECLAEEYDGDCCLAPSCRLKGVLQEAHDAFFRHLDQYTIKDLIGKRATFAPIHFHQTVASAKAKTRHVV
jgi:Rrf2 family transcriptional regulator, nitric oxide-sensitive transcriptional repressor